MYILLYFKCAMHKIRSNIFSCHILVFSIALLAMNIRWWQVCDIVHECSNTLVDAAGDVVRTVRACEKMYAEHALTYTKGFAINVSTTTWVLLLVGRKLSFDQSLQTVLSLIQNRKIILWESSLEMVDRAWDIVSGCVPVHSLNEAIPAPYETVIGNLYLELRARGFANDCVECLKKRPRRPDDHSLSLFDLFCAPDMPTGMSESVFEVKLEGLNIWKRYDFESYLMVAAIVRANLWRLPPWDASHFLLLRVHRLS